MSDTPITALVEEALIKPALELCGTRYELEAGYKHRLLSELAHALRRTIAEREEAKRDAEAYKRQTQEVSAKAIELTKEVCAKLDRAEAERDAQHAEVLRLTGERDEARLRLKASEEGLRVVTMERDHAQQVEAPDAFWQRDEARAQVWGLICAGSNMAERKRYFQGLWETLLADGLKRDAQLSELITTRVRLTAENARLQKELERARDLRRETLGVRMIDNLTTQLAEVTRQRDEAYDTQFAVMWGYICLGTNTRDVQDFVEVGLPAMARKVKALEAHIATLELLLRGGK